jgi:hypothetical protein
MALIVLASAWRTAIMGGAHAGHPVHLNLSPGTRIVTRNDANRIGGGQVIPAGAVAVVVKSPMDAQHAYKVRFNDGAEAMLRRNEFSILKEFKSVPERGCVADQPQHAGRVKAPAADASHNAALHSDSPAGNADFEFWQPFITYRFVRQGPQRLQTAPAGEASLRSQ